MTDRETSGSPIRVAFQGEKGAYSEQAVYELLGRNRICAVGHKSFDDAFTAVNKGDVDLLMVPIENSLGGTIHANCDLQLRHSLFIIAEYDLRVRHCLMALPGTQKADLKKIISHEQALAQCDSYIRSLGIPREAAYDTAGSAKIIAEGRLEGVAAICSELASEVFQLEILARGIEDDSNNFTRFLLLRSEPVCIPPGIKCKTSIVFSLENVAGALFKALSVFALREIDLTKIESRPCKPDIMHRLEREFLSITGLFAHRGRQTMAPYLKKRRIDNDTAPGDGPYRYLFYADFHASVDHPNAANAIKHLQEITTFFRILGSYPAGGSLIGLDVLGQRPIQSPEPEVRRQRCGIVGFGTFGQFIAKKMVLDFDVFVTNWIDASSDAATCGVTWCMNIADLIDKDLDIVVIAVSVLSFETVVRKFAKCIKARESSAGAAKSGPIVVDVLSVKAHAKTTLLALLPESCDILCTHPMFGPVSGMNGWSGLPLVFERVRLRDARRCEDFLKWFKNRGCRMIDMTCELHDDLSAGSQFVTHLTGRVLGRLGLNTTPINTKGFESLLQLVDNTCSDSFDLFHGLYKFNPNSEQQLQAIEHALKDVSEQLRDGSKRDAAARSCDAAPKPDASA